MNSVFLSFLFLLFFVLATTKPYNAMSFSHYSGIPLGTPTSIAAVHDMKAVGVEIFSLINSWYLKDINDTNVHPVEGLTTDDEGVERILQEARKLGMKVLMKPHCDLQSHVWRANIGTYFTPSQWDAFFTSYTSFITHYAAISAKYSDVVTMFSAGVEYVTPSRQSSHWREVIAAIRSVYNGTITYSANHGTEIDNVDWFDAIDVLGCDAYYPLTKNLKPNYDELLEGWAPVFTNLKNVSEFWNKPMMFTEIGYMSVTGCAASPAGYHGPPRPLNMTQQAMCYQAVFDTFYDAEWWEGAFWWSWDTNSFFGGTCDGGFTPHNKPAEEILKKYYLLNSVVEKKKALYDSQEPSIKASEFIYTNGKRGEGWQSWSWGAKLNFSDTRQPFGSDKYTLYAQLEDNGALRFHHDGFETSGYDLFSFALHTSPSFTNLDLFFSGLNNTKLVEIPLINFATAQNCTIPDNKWVEFSFDLSDIFIEDTIISFVTWRGGGKEEDFWIDAITFAG